MDDLSGGPVVRIEASDERIEAGEQVELTIHTGYEIGGSFQPFKTTSVAVSPAVSTTYEAADLGSGLAAPRVTVLIAGQPTEQPRVVRVLPAPESLVLEPPEGDFPSESSLSLEAGPAVVGIGPGASSFAVAGGSLAVVSGSDFYVTVQAGARWMGPSGEDPSFPTAPRPAFQDRRQTLVSLGLSHYVWDAVGLSFSGVAAWEVVRGSDYYLKRAYGAAGGVRYRRPVLGRRLVVGLDLLYSDLSEFQRVDSRWRLAISPSVTLNVLR
ncbi:MAG: hypothetical protein HKN72_17580 [Gemmatimonadetes bacterium]|nr:hypothetical protein [Gemmatimonadota bacterium]